MSDPVRSIPVDDDLWRRTKACADRDGIPVAALVREALVSRLQIPPKDFDPNSFGEWDGME